MGAANHRGQSKQDYETPKEFLVAVRCKFQISSFSIDLAADEKNAKVPVWFDEKMDSFQQDWTQALDGGWGWLNPPFNNISPWATKCLDEYIQGANIMLLVPASVGSNWYKKYIHDYAITYFLNGRLSFDGKNPFPKDCMLCVYGIVPTIPVKKHYVWDWKKDLTF